jgi:hypothetical protein
VSRMTLETQMGAWITCLIHPRQRTMVGPPRAGTGPLQTKAHPLRRPVLLGVRLHACAH